VILDPAVALRKSALFRDLPGDTLQRLVAIAQRRSYRRGELIVRQGDPGDTFFVITDGEVKVLVGAQTGDQAMVAIFGPGDCFGELSLIDGEPRSASVEAIDHVETIILWRRDFMDFVDANPQFMKRLLMTLANRIRHTSELAADLAFLDIAGRLAKTLLDLARDHGRQVDGATEIELPMTQTDLAAMVGATRESVNKLLSWFEERGGIERHGRQITVVDPELLRQRIT
jgi:CRP/FNR family transcriptional regulator/CRP/FNR family cyclic AMP-dependent transcriptional regulator